MATSKDRFSINIVLHHPTYTPESITQALSIKPLGSHAVGDKFAGLQAKRTSFHACLQKGDNPSQYEDALHNVALFIEKSSAFWADFMSGDGEVELILNHTIVPQEEEGDKLLELYLAPAFLRDLSARGIGLRVQAWQGT